MSSTRAQIADVVASMLGAAAALSVDVSVVRAWDSQVSIAELKVLTTPLLTVIPVDQQDERDSRSTFGESYTIDVAVRAIIADKSTSTIDAYDAITEEVSKFFRSRRLTERTEVFTGSEYMTVIDPALMNQLVYVGIVRLTFAKAGVS